jgi:hypothetical protein
LLNFGSRRYFHPAAAGGHSPGYGMVKVRKHSRQNLAATLTSATETSALNNELLWEEAANNQQGGSSMQSRSSLLSAVTLSTAMFFGTAAMAGDLPKEGMSSGTFSYVVGTLKPTPIGKERLLISWDGNGLSFTNGFGDHMSWHCWATGDYTNGVGGDQGYCVATDISGDQFIDIFNDDKHALDAKSFGGTDKWSGGTGKYAGISGGGKYICHPADFKSPAEGTFLGYCTLDWNYKLP